MGTCPVLRLSFNPLSLSPRKRGIPLFSGFCLRWATVNGTLGVRSPRSGCSVPVRSPLEALAVGKVKCRKSDLVVIVICVLGAAGVALMLLASLPGCGSMWEAREAELVSYGYTQEQVDTQIAMERDALAQEILELKDMMIDVVPGVPAPIREPVKDLTDYWLYPILVAVGVLGRDKYNKIRDAEPRRPA